MKTIEQRAEDYMNNYPNMDDSHYDYYVRDGYIKGATDQQQIDINRAVSWLVLAINGDNLEGCRDIKALIEELKQTMTNE